MLRLIFHLVQDHLPQHIPEKHNKSLLTPKIFIEIKDQPVPTAGSLG